MKSSLTNSQVVELLETLYAHASQSDPLVHEAARKAGLEAGTEVDFYRAMRKAYMPVGRAFGNLLYGLARSARARTIVEFGTSFGISTIFLASAIRDNGGGKVITTEFDSEKAEGARQNLTAAGLVEWVDFRVGDALETLRANLPHEIDLVLLDGAKGLYLDVLKLVEPHLRSGAIVASDNTDHDGMRAFLEHVRSPGHGYRSSAILTTDRKGTRGHEISLKN